MPLLLKIYAGISMKKEVLIKIVKLRDVRNPEFDISQRFFRLWGLPESHCWSISSKD